MLRIIGACTNGSVIGTPGTTPPWATSGLVGGAIVCGGVASGGGAFPATIGRDGNQHGFTREILEQIMRDNPQVFASQYLNCPMLESQQIITKEEMEAAC